MSANILLVEDQIITSFATKSLLEKYGYNVFIVSSGEEAVLFFTKENSIDLILMDIDLGFGINGIEAARQILKTRRIPIIFLTSHNEMEIKDKTQDINIFGHINKNNNIALINLLIKNAIDLYKSKKTNQHK